MTPKPQFSVVVPTFNRRGLLVQTLDTVWAQSFADYELIVVDDGSTDGTADYLKKLGGRAKVLTQTNQGPGVARNLALRHATGEYVAFLDSDDLWFPWSLEVFAEVIKRHKHPSFITGQVMRFRDGAELAAVQPAPVATNVFADYLASGDEWRWYGLSSFVMKREAIEAAGGFPVEAINGEDSDLALRCGIAPGYVQITAPVTFGYREHSGGVRHVAGKNLSGDMHRITMEEQGRYPGGEARALERWRILTLHLRANSLECLRAGLRAEAWEIFRRTLRWNVALGRWRYVVGFPVKAFSTSWRSMK